MLSKKSRYFLFTSTANLIIIFSTGAIIQSFLASKQFTNQQIGFYTFSISAMQIVTLLLSAFFSDKIKNIPKTMAFFTLPSIVFFGTMIYICVSDGLPTSTAFALAMGVCCLWNFFYGLRIVIDYKLPYYVINISEYPALLNISGIIQSILGIVVSGLFIFFSKIFPYKSVILVCFILSIIFVLTTSLTVYSLKNEVNLNEEKHENKPTLEIFRLPQMRYLVVPNYIRGIANGIMGMAAVIMLSTVTGDISVSSTLTSIAAVASALSCFVYSKIYKRVKTAKLCLIGGIIEFTALLFILAGKGNVKLFIAMYFIGFAGEVIVDYAIPVFITEIVPYDLIGGYTSIRMLLFTAGVVTGNYMAGVLASGSPRILMLLCGSAELITAVWYFIYYKLNERNKNHEWDNVKSGYNRVLFYKSKNYR